MLELQPAQLVIVRGILTRRIPDREVRAFGSRVTGKARPQSDLDLVIMGDEPISDRIKMEITTDFDDSDLPFRVDVMQWPDAPETLQQVILKTSTTVNP